MYDEPALIDKVALVFGGSRGIGAAIVRRLAADGASVALTYANSADKATETARAAEAHGRPVIAIKADSADPKAIVDAVAQTTKQGWVFLFDRETGKPLFPLKSRSYPPSDLEGEVTAKKQSLPVLPARS